MDEVALILKKTTEEAGRSFLKTVPVAGRRNGPAFGAKILALVVCQFIL